MTSCWSLSFRGWEEVCRVKWDLEGYFRANFFVTKLAVRVENSLVWFCNNASFWPQSQRTVLWMKSGCAHAYQSGMNHSPVLSSAYPWWFFLYIPYGSLKAHSNSCWWILPSGCLVFNLPYEKQQCMNHKLTSFFDYEIGCEPVPRSSYNGWTTCWVTLGKAWAADRGKLLPLWHGTGKALLKILCPVLGL